MESIKYISQRNLKGIRPNGEKIHIVVAVGIPYQNNEYDSWACPVKIEGLHEKLADQHGIDSWQALRLAQKLIESMLSHFIEKGGKLYIFGEDKEVTLNEVHEYF